MKHEKRHGLGLDTAEARNYYRDKLSLERKRLRLLVTYLGSTPSEIAALRGQVDSPGGFPEHKADFYMDVTMSMSEHLRLIAKSLAKIDKLAAKVAECNREEGIEQPEERDE